MLDPQARALLDLMVERGVPPTHTLTPAEARRLYRERRSFTQPDPPAVGAVRELTVAGGAGPVAARLYLPAAAASPPPVLAYFHGGGWTIGDLDTHDVLCRQLCVASGAALLSVDYGLGPERRFPAAFDDCLAATRWLQREGAALGVDARRLAVGGDSAGGNLAAAVAIALRDGGDAAPAFQLLIYPATDMRALAPSHTVNGQGYLLTADSIAYYRGHYIEETLDWADWRASPLLAADLSRLPPALMITAGYDPLRDEGRQYADALSAAGVPVQYLCFERQIHGFFLMGGLIDEARTAVAVASAWLKRGFERG